MSIEERIAALQQNISLVSTVGAEFIQKVYFRLEKFGYTVTEEDDWMLGFIIQKVEKDIMNSCNITSIPDGLEHKAIDMICGEFLFSMKQSGKLQGFDLETAIKTVQTGDTSVTYAIGNGSKTPEQRLDTLLLYMMNSGKGDYACYRKIKW